MSPKERSFSIEFGDIHSYSRDESLQCVILDIGEENYFYVAQILAGGRLGLPGTGHVEDIAEIVGKMDFDEIKRGLELAFGGPLGDTILSNLEMYSRKPSRVISR